MKILDSGGTGKEGMLSVASSATAVEFSPDGNFVIVGEAKDRVTVWSWPDQEPILSKTNLSGRVNRLAFSRDNRLHNWSGSRENQWFGARDFTYRILALWGFILERDCRSCGPSCISTG